MVYDNDSNNTQDKVIRGKALYFSTSQVANVLNETDSKIRYYTNVFDDILHIEISNKQRRYTEADIDKLKFIIELKSEGMTIKQIQEYCQEVNFENTKEIQIKENNPLSVQTMAKALLEQQASLIEQMQNNIILQQQQMIDSLQQIIIQNNESMRQELSLTVDETICERNETLKQEVYQLISNRLNESSNNLNIKLEEQHQQIQDNFESLNNQNKERDVVLVDNLLQKMNERKEENRKINEQQEKQSLFSRIFNRNK